MTGHGFERAAHRENTKGPIPGFALRLATWLQENAGVAIAIAFAGYLSLLAIAHYADLPAWLTSGKGLSVNQLGPLGDSFAPLTSIFAALAALGAWRSYAAQKQLLRDERNRHRGTRFDETFFRLIEHYDRELERTIIDVQRNKDSIIDPGIYKGADALTAFKRTVKIMQFADARPGADLATFKWGLSLKQFKRLVLLRDQEVAITRWLKRQSSNVKVEFRGSLLAGKLSDDELWFWYFSVMCVDEPELEEFASRLGIHRKRAKRAGKLEAPSEMEPPSS